MSRGVLIIACLLGLATVAAGAEESPLRDPTQPYRSQAGAVPGAGAVGPRYVLSAVLISPTRRVAVLNGTPYQQGERVAGAEITRIELQSVQLRRGSEELVIHLSRARTDEPGSEGDSAP